MSNYNSLKATINANIKTNGNQEITGAVLNSVLTDIVNALAAGYIFKGIAEETTNPGTPDQNVFYIAGGGSYRYFGNRVVENGQLAFFMFNGSWTYKTLDFGFGVAVEDIADAVAAFEIADEDNNVILRISNGHIRTKNFNSGNMFSVVGKQLIIN